MGKSERAIKTNPPKFLSKEIPSISSHKFSEPNQNSSSLNQKELSKNNISPSSNQKITVLAPFGSTSIKTILSPPKLTNEPGPGSYALNTSKLNTLNSKKFFITGESRFKSSNNNIPGVGEYDINIYDNNKLINKYCNTPNRIRSLHDFILYEKINTLPDKYLMYNFNETEFQNSFDMNNMNTNNSLKNSKKNILSLKHNNAIDWKKVSKKNLEVPLNNKNINFNYINNINNVNNINNKDFVMLTEFNIISNQEKSEDEEKTKKTSQNKNEQNIYKNHILGFKDSFNSKYINLTSMKNDNQKKEQIDPGPGAYNPKNDNFKIEKKKEKFQNFGTYESRNMFPITRTKKKLDYYENDKNKYNNNNKEIIESKNKLNKYKRLLHNLRINIIQEQSKNYKKNIQNNLGPGSYSPDNYFNINTKNKNFSKTIITESAQNEDKKRTFFEKNVTPGVGQYDIMGELKKNLEYNLSLERSRKEKEMTENKIRMDNIKKNYLKKKEKKFYFLDYVDTQEYKMRKYYKDNNIYRPPFNSAVPKFTFDKKNYNDKSTSCDINIDYNDIKKENKSINIPFLSGVKRWKSIEKYGGRLGPGTYEQKSFFDWNKKSFNVQYKLK